MNRATAKFCDNCGHPVRPREEARPRTPHAERRHMTVLFCDMVGSTALSDRLDPEDLRDIMRDYIDRCAQAVESFEGYISQTRGDGLVVFYGFPQAHEDDAERAIRTGLAILQSITAADGRAVPMVQVRIGIHSGLVVAGEIGGRDIQKDKAIVGDTPNIAARLQELAAPNTMVVSEQLRQIAGPAFDYEDLGPKLVKGIQQPIRVHRVLRERDIEGRYDPSRGELPFIGREQEIGLLLECWERCQRGEGQVVMLVGEPGIGKSRLVGVLQGRLAGQVYRRARFQCSPYYSSTALYPVIKYIETAAGLVRDEPVDGKLDKIEAMLSAVSDQVTTAAALFATLLSIPCGHRYTISGLTAQQLKDRTIAQIVDLLLALAAAEPMLAIFEDLHWIDPTSLELLELLVQRGGEAKLLLLATVRSDFQLPLSRRPNVRTLALNRLTRRQSAEIVGALAQAKPLPPPLVEQVIEKAEGIPLFVEEITKTVLAAGAPAAGADGRARARGSQELALPATLAGWLTQRLDRLGPDKEVAQVAAAVGREFSPALVARIAGRDDAELKEAMHKLVGADIVTVVQREPSAETTYSFKHALLQDAAYSSMLKRTRQDVHARIVSVLQEHYPHVVQREPEVLAQHCARADLTEQGIAYYLEAGKRAMDSSAHVEAVAHLRNGLALLEQHPEVPDRVRQELALQTALGVPLIATQGYAAPETGAAFARARELCESLNEPVLALQALFGLWGHHWMRAEWNRALELAKDILPRAEQQEDHALHALAFRVLGSTVWGVGDFDAARTHFERSILVSDNSQASALGNIYAVDPGIASTLLLAWTLWLQGHPDSALREAEKGVAYAESLAHAYTLAFATFILSMVHLLRGDAQSARQWSARALSISEKQHFPYWHAYSKVVSGWADVVQGAIGHGLECIREGTEEHARMGIGIMRPTELGFLAQAYAAAGEPARGLRELELALDSIERTNERLWEAETHRLKGELTVLEDPGAIDAAAAHCLKALEVARAQKARGLELRAASSLAALWQRQGRTREAREVLAAVYGTFHQGTGTADLVQAEQLLAALG